MPIAMYPGSFDPVTRGHLDIIRRSSRMFDKLIVAVLVNSAKTPLFTVEERVAMLRECCKRHAQCGGGFLQRAGPSVSPSRRRRPLWCAACGRSRDFENEIQLAHTNYAMMPEIETMFLATAIQWSYLSSTIVREAAHYGQDVSRFVTPQRRESPHRQARGRAAVMRIQCRPGGLKIKSLSKKSIHVQQTVSGGYL